MKISLGNIYAKKSVSLASSSKIATGPESSLSKGLDFNSSSTPSSSLSAFDSSSSSVCLSSLETSSTSISELTPSYSFVKPPKLFLFVRYDPKQIVYEIHKHYKPFLKSVRPYENMLFTVLNVIILKFYCGNPMTSYIKIQLLSCTFSRYLSWRQRRLAGDKITSSSWHAVVAPYGACRRMRLDHRERHCAYGDLRQEEWGAIWRLS